ncbi:MAG: RNA polymerase sigma factor [Gammaproteobacteria bacterium]
MTQVAGRRTGDALSHASDPESDEILLMRRIAGKDRQALESLYYDYAPRIGSFLIKMLKSRELVDEGVNEVMVTVWQNAERFDPAQGKLLTWLFGIARNKALKLLEKQRKTWCEQTLDPETSDQIEFEAEEQTLTDEQVDPDNPERTVIGWELGSVLLWAMEQLTPEHRMVLELTFSEQLPYQDVAAITGCPVNTVKTRVFHARKKLAGLLASRGYPI